MTRFQGRLEISTLTAFNVSPNRSTEFRKVTIFTTVIDGLSDGTFARFVMTITDNSKTSRHSLTCLELKEALQMASAKFTSFDPETTINAFLGRNCSLKSRKLIVSEVVASEAPILGLRATSRTDNRSDHTVRSSGRNLSSV